jgi:hypothetical protein
MTKQKEILKMDYLDLLFADKNKNYGVYKLRKTTIKLLCMQ